MKCQIGKQNFNSQEIFQQLQEKGEQNKECCEFFRIYKDLLLEQQVVIQKFTEYGGNTFTQNLKKLQRENSQNSCDIQSLLISEIQDRRERAQSEYCGLAESPCLMPSKSKLVKAKSQISNDSIGEKQSPITKQQQQISYEGELAIQQQKIEQLEKTNGDYQKRIDELQLNLQEMMKEKRKVEKELEIESENLVSARMQITDFKETCDNQQINIEQLVQDKNNLSDKIISLEEENRKMIDRLVQEKMKIVEKLNEINKQEEDLNLKRAMFQDEANYHNQRKQQFQQQLQENGLKLPETAPSISSLIQSCVKTDYDLPTAIQKKLFKQHGSEIISISSNLNGSLIATCSTDRYIKIYDTINQASAGKIYGNNASQIFVESVFSPYNEFLLTGTTDNKVILFNSTSTKKLKDFLGHGQQVNSVGFLSDKSKFVTGSNDRTIKFWDINKTTVCKNIQTGSPCRTIANFYSEPHIMTGHENGSIRMYTLKDGSNKPIYDIPNLFNSPICNIQISNNGNLLAVTSKQGDEIKVFDVRKLTQYMTLGDSSYYNSHDNNKCTFGPNENFVIAGGQGGIVSFWDIRNTNKEKLNKVVSDTKHEGTVVSAHYHNTTGNLYTGDSKGNLFIWN